LALSIRWAVVSGSGKYPRRAFEIGSAVPAFTSTTVAARLTGS